MKMQQQLQHQRSPGGRTATSNSLPLGTTERVQAPSGTRQTTLPTPFDMPQTVPTPHRLWPQSLQTPPGLPQTLKPQQLYTPHQQRSRHSIIRQPEWHQRPQEGIKWPSVEVPQSYTSAAAKATRTHLTSTKDVTQHTPLRMPVESDHPFTGVPKADNRTSNTKDQTARSIMDAAHHRNHMRQQLRRTIQGRLAASVCASTASAASAHHDIVNTQWRANEEVRRRLEKKGSSGEILDIHVQSSQLQPTLWSIWETVRHAPYVCRSSSTMLQWCIWIATICSIVIAGTKH